MDLRKGIIFTRFYFVFVFLFAFVCCINGSAPSKSPIAEEIMKKVSSLTLNALSKAPHQTKETILNKIENRLRKSAKSIGPDADKYISLIMGEFKAKMAQVFTAKEKINDHDHKKAKDRSVISRTKQEENSKPRETIDSQTKEEIIKEIANKIQKLARLFLKNAKTFESKEQILEKIKNKIMDSTKEKHTELHNKHTELKTYSSLIAQGVKVSMRKILESEAVGRRMDGQVLAKPVSDRRIMEEELNENVTKVEEDILNHADVVLNLEDINTYRDLIEQSLNGTSEDPRCDEIVKDTCHSIQLINQIPCDKGKVIPIESLCNNVFDCLNGVDENNCTAQAMKQVRIATKVMSEVEVSIKRKCFTLTEDSLLMSQNQILREVLQTQMNFLEKHDNTPFLGTESKYQNDKFVKAAVNDVSTILSTLSYALDGALCARISDPQHQGNNDFRKFNDIEVDVIEALDEVPQEVGWSPKSCRCKEQFCVDPNCQAVCKQVCWQKHSLNHWACQALNGATSVSLNVICDGKLDCFDETDENSCVTNIYNGTSSKFEAAKTYSILLDLLSTKSKSNDFIKSRNKLLSLHGLVRQLQKQTIRTNADTHTIKNLRDEAFKLLVTIYEDSLETNSFDELEDHYLILQAVNEKLITALKGSHTGNEILISPKECYCRDGLCALLRCNKHCIQACLAEPLLTKFACDDVKNRTIPIEAICDGITNCAKEEDEQHCAKDVCRGHHLVMLRHNLENVGVKHKGTVMGEVIESWKAKETAALIVAETTQRTTHKVIVEIVHRVLQDLVMAFAAMENYRRSNSEYALQEFKSISKIVMQTLKSCTY